jgi:uncharacterized protein (TIGR00255 family)
MTGYGSSNIELSTGTILYCYIRALNHKYLNISVTLPERIIFYEPKIVKLLKTHFNRGRIEASFSIGSNSHDMSSLTIDSARAKKCYKLLLKLKKELDIQGDVDLNLLSNFSNIFVQESTQDISLTKIKKYLLQVLNNSIDKVKTMQLEEGKTISADFEKRLMKLKKDLKFIKKRSKSNITLWRRKINEKLDSLKNAIKLDEGRLEKEALLFAVKSDIKEECVRLENHIKQFEKSLKTRKPKGKKLGFLLQEMIREINTLYAKTINSEIQKRSVQIREGIENLREQVYNIE